MLVSQRMKAHILLAVFSATLLVPAQVRADESPLAQQMEHLDDAYKGFRREKDPAAGAEQARKAQTAVATSLAEIPAMLTKMPDGPEKSKAISSYRQTMGELYVLLCKAEQAFLNEKVDEIPALVDEMKKLKKTGHTNFMEDE